MKKFVIGIALGAAAGLVLSEIPTVKNIMQKGKKKVEKMTK